MTHDCRINYLETSQDEEGYLYIEWKKVFGTVTGKFKVEYCPICGQKAKKSNIDNLTLFPRKDIQETISEKMHRIIMEMFLSSCETLIRDKLDDHSYQFCVDTINNTLIYLRSKRQEGEK